MSDALTLPSPTRTFASAAPSIATARSEFARLLGLDAPVDDGVLQAALDDESYASGLLDSRRDPAMLQRLLASPPALPQDDAKPPSAFLLARRATFALARWARTGFATVDTVQLERRQAACRACPHREAPAVERDAPRTTVAQALGSCGLCGCPLARKTRMASERCPDTHTLNRWGEGVDAQA
jgi:hypothetical protein